jgi:hypothetical protein
LPTAEATTIASLSLGIVFRGSWCQPPYRKTRVVKQRCV